MNERYPWLKTALELGPLLVFFVVYLLWRNETVTLWGEDYSGFILATLAFIPALVASTLGIWALTGKVSAMQVATLVLVLVFGGLSIWLNDPRFFKVKVTLIYLLFAAILGFAILTDRNWLQLVLGEALPMRAEGWRILTQRTALLFLAMAMLNEIVWRTMSESTWVYFKTFGLTLILFVFLLANARLYRDYAIEDEGEKP